MRSDNMAGADGDGPVFFLSYAHIPRVDRNDRADPNSLVAEFSLDLRRSLVNISDLPIGEGIGFMDRGFRPGNEWSAGLARALSTCKVFVPLYSPRYFTKENCGKEWSAFEDRVAAATGRRGTRVEAIVPALWVPVPYERLPRVAQPIQYWAPDFSSAYATLGIYKLMTISKYKAEYEEVVHELASRILDVAENSRLEPGPVADYHSLRNAFEPGSQESQEPDQ
jgi:TIR domain